MKNPGVLLRLWKSPDHFKRRSMSSRSKSCQVVFPSLHVMNNACCMAQAEAATTKTKGLTEMLLSSEQGAANISRKHCILDDKGQVMSGGELSFAAVFLACNACPMAAAISQSHILSAEQARIICKVIGAPDKLPQLMHLRPHSLSALLVLQLLNLVGFFVQCTFLHIRSFLHNDVGRNAKATGLATCVTANLLFCGFCNSSAEEFQRQQQSATAATDAHQYLRTLTNVVEASGTMRMQHRCPVLAVL